ncbi:hypothetical protein BB561_001275 [Smittium simulii]|uniref:DUF1754-domain-containing protein n=1 Tax=Smittium simulii TaxID=133385 RepID=A0A2T9YVE4_9FUNG|nr:hypothetical protein BB561_001275 [Smittium simulii]
MSEYNIGAIKAPLKLKHKSKTKSKRKRRIADEEGFTQELISGNTLPNVPALKNEIDSPSLSGDSSSTLTESEKRFKKTQEKRREERINQFIQTSHKEKVQEFNEKLGRLPEHHEMPKVGPG